MAGADGEIDSARHQGGPKGKSAPRTELVALLLVSRIKIDAGVSISGLLEGRQCLFNAVHHGKELEKPGDRHGVLDRFRQPG